MTSVSLAEFREIFRSAASSDENILPLSEFENSFQEWTDNCSDPFIAESLNNIGLITAAVSRSVSLERLISVRANENDTITMSFDFIRSAEDNPEHIQFEINISKEEAEKILQSDLPVKEVIRITDSKIQIGLCKALAL